MDTSHKNCEDLPTPSNPQFLASCFSSHSGHCAPILLPCSETLSVGGTLFAADVVRVFIVYLTAMALMRPWNPSLCPRWISQGLPMSHFTIARWICQAVVQTCSTKKWVSSFLVKAHSTITVSASWTFQLQASTLQICKTAATWSSGSFLN